MVIVQLDSYSAVTSADHLNSSRLGSVPALRFVLAPLALSDSRFVIRDCFQLDSASCFTLRALCYLPAFTMR